MAGQGIDERKRASRGMAGKTPRRCSATQSQRLHIVLPPAAFFAKPEEACILAKSEAFRISRC